MKTRFAPSPTGLMHLGNVRTALFSALLAQSAQGHFILRIEDTDQERSEQRYVTALKQDLTWLGLNWQEGPEVGGDNGPYFQSERLALYDGYYQQLIEQKRAYPCFCSEAKLEMTRKAQRAAGQPPRYPGTCRGLSAAEVEEKLSQGLKPSLRFVMPAGETIEFTDVVKGLQRFNSDDIGDFIIRRSNNTPAFMFCNAIDDALMGVTHVLRGEDHLTNSPRQLAILKVLDLPVPSYGHISIIQSKDGSKLSKRDGSFSIADLRAEGYLPQAVINYMARLGHYFGDLGLADAATLAQHFKLESLAKSAARFDQDQLHYWQKEAVLALEGQALWDWLLQQQTELEQLVPLEQQQPFTRAIQANIVFPADALAWAQRLFTDQLAFNDEAKAVLQTAGADFFTQAIACAESGDGSWQALVQAVKAETGQKGKTLFQPLRVALTGQLHGPEMAPLVTLLGKPAVIARLQAVVGIL